MFRVRRNKIAVHDRAGFATEDHSLADVAGGGHVQDFQLFGGFGFLGYYLVETVKRVEYEDLVLEKRAVSIETTGQRGRDASGVIADVVGWLWPF